MTTDEVRLMGRAKNAVLAYFENHLSIPKIYIDAEWDGHRVDVLAINRDGVGDVHAVTVFLPKADQEGAAEAMAYKREFSDLLGQLSHVAAHFKYIAVVSPWIQGGNFIVPEEFYSRDFSQKLRPAFLSLDTSFSPDGLGRVGLLSCGSSMSGEIEVSLEIKPERFRAKIAKLADEYVQQHEADWEIRA